MATQVEKAVPLQQAVVQEQLGSTMPLPNGLGFQAMCSEGEGAASGSGAAAKGSAAAYSGKAGAASGNAGAASGSAGAGSGRGPTAAPWTSQGCIWRWPVELHELKEDMAKAQEFFNASVHNVAVTGRRKADW